MDAALNLPFPSYTFDKTVLSSSTVASQANYAIGVAHNKVLYLHPVNGILQMRPNFDYVDMGSVDEKILNKEINIDEGHAEESEAASSIKMENAILPTFTRRETEKTANAKKKSHAYIQSQIHQEPWVVLKYSACDTDEAEEAWEKIMEPEARPDESEMVPKSSEPVFNLSPKEYLHLISASHYESPSSSLSLSSLSIATTTAGDSVPAGAASSSSASSTLAASSTPGPSLSTSSMDNYSLPLEERIRSILINAELVSTRKLCDILEMGDETPVVRAAELCAYVVKGNWVVKSEVLYGGSVSSDLTGTPILQLTKARNYMLYLLATKDFIQKKDVTDEVKIPAEDLNEMFKKITVLRHRVGYTLKLPLDTFLQER